MKYYDVAISLGQYCITSTALRRCKLQDISMVFDWSGGVIPEKCGRGGLEGKVDLILNNFEHFFEYEDLQNRGNNKEDDFKNLWIVNKRTGLQYRHDFHSSKTIEDSYLEVKNKYDRRAKRLLEVINNSHRILFVYMSREGNFENEFLILQQEKLQKKYPDKIIDFLYVMNNSNYKIDKYDMYQITPQVIRIDCNFIYPTSTVSPEDWNGNTKLYYPILEENFFTPATINFIRKKLTALEKDFNSEISISAKLNKKLSDLEITFNNKLKDFFKLYKIRHIIYFKYYYYRFISNLFVWGGVN